MLKQTLIFLLVLSLSAMFAAELRQLPPAEKKGGMPLLEALAARKSSRDFKAGASLTAQELSTLLWCANGFNREKMRTAPSAVNAQAISIYVFDSEAIWLYVPESQALQLVRQGDHRKAAGMQPFVANAAVNLLYVYDLEKWPGKEKSDGKWASADAAFCAENVYLYCASAKLKTVVRGSFDAKALTKLLGLPKTMLPVLAQSVGR